MKRKAFAKVHESKCVTPDTLGFHVLFAFLEECFSSQQPREMSKASIHLCTRELRMPHDSQCWSPCTFHQSVMTAPSFSVPRSGLLARTLRWLLLA